MDALLNKFKRGLNRTRTMLVRGMQSLFTETEAWNEETYERLEAALIQSDIGIGVTEYTIKNLRNHYEEGNIHTSADILEATKSIFSDILGSDKAEFSPNLQLSPPTIILLVGVNGSGKTTTTGKLASRFTKEGKSVLLAACDTFRAAAIEQLKLWGKRVNCPVIAGNYQTDAASVAYDAVKATLARKADILLIDTAGRQHTRKGLMDELEKIKRTIHKALPGAPHEIWLVVDGSTGTNALQQAKIFQKQVGINGLCVTKLDGSGKGGVVLAIYQELEIPIYFLGLGENDTDLQPFNKTMFITSLLEEG